MANKTKAFTAAITAVLNGADPIETADKLIADSKTNTLPDPPAEIKLDVNPKTEEKETTMETTKTAKPTRTNLVALATELNSFLTDCKISTKKAIADEVITAQIMSHTFELVWTDFTPINEGDKVFSHESIETLIMLGITIPTAPVTKADKPAKKDKVKSDKYTWEDATENAIRTLCTEGATLIEIRLKAIDNYREKDPTNTEVPKNVFRSMTNALIRFNVLTKNDDSKLTFITIESAK